MTKSLSSLCGMTIDPGAIGRTGAPAWVHLFPPGKIEGRDGRRYVLSNPAAVMRDFEQRGVDLPVDYEHQSETTEARMRGPVPAAGWIKELRLEDTGLWGRVEWTATAGEMIAKREYRYLSPAFTFDQNTKEVLRLKGAGLVHNPNLHLTALASEESDMATPDAFAAPQPKTTGTGGGTIDPAILAKLAASLGLPEDSDAEAVLAALIAQMQKKPAADAVASQMPDPSRFVPIEVVRDLLEDRKAQIATMRETEAEAKIGAAIKEGHITPAMRPWATALCRQDPALFDDFLAKSPAPFAHLSRPVTLGNAFGTASEKAAHSAEAAAICAQLGLSPDELNS